MRQAIKISRIQRDPNLQARVSLDTERVSEYVELLKDNPSALPPILVYHDQAAEKYWCPDGWHRIEANTILGHVLIEAEVLPGTKEEAILRCVGSNASHGLPRTSADKRRSIKLLLLHVPGWAKKSDREIAKACALTDHKLVGVVYREMVAGGELPERGDIEGADGKTRRPPQKATGGIPQLSAPTKPRLSIETPQEAAARASAAFDAPAAPSTTRCQRCGELKPSGVFGWSYGLLVCAPCRSALNEEHSAPAKQEEIKEAQEVTPIKSLSDYLRILASQQHEADVDAVTGDALRDYPDDCDEIEVARVVRLAQIGKLRPKQSTRSTPEKEESYQHWNTPRWLVDLIASVNKIALDPCSNQWSQVGARVAWTVDDDGLRVDRSWAQVAHDQGGLVYVNPPYSDPLPWAQRAVKEASAGAEIVLCLPTSHSTKWWRLLSQSCQVLALCHVRVPFEREGQRNAKRAKHETTLFYFGPRAEAFIGIFGTSDIDTPGDSLCLVVERVPYALRGVVEDKPRTGQLALPQGPAPKKTPGREA